MPGWLAGWLAGHVLHPSPCTYPPSTHPPGALPPQDRRAFVRDAVAYLLSPLALLHLLWRGRFGVWEGAYLLSG